MPKITVSLPFYLRPQRTQRIIRALRSQTFTDFQAFVVGDNCPHYEEVTKGLEKDPRFWTWNMPKQGAYWGYKITQASINHAKGEYFMFLANDDMIAPNHLENYLGEIDGTNFDFVFFDSYVLGRHYNYRLQRGHIGDNALIIKTSFLQQMPPREPIYGHDWDMIQNMIKAGARYKKSKNAPTYFIMSSPKQRTDMLGID